METGIIWKDVFTIGMILFAVIDIVGSIPIIVDLRSKMGHIQSEKATIVAAVIMIAFLFVGDEILKLIGIDANSFAVAGSFVLFFLAEIGDKTQVATIALAARFDSIFWVMAGTTVGMMIANAPAVFIGDKLADKLPISLIHKIGASIFLLIGVSTLVQHYFF